MSDTGRSRTDEPGGDRGVVNQPACVSSAHPASTAPFFPATDPQGAVCHPQYRDEGGGWCTFCRRALPPGDVSVASPSVPCGSTDGVKAGWRCCSPRGRCPVHCERCTSYAYLYPDSGLCRKCTVNNEGRVAL